MKQVAIVAGDFHDEALAIEAEALGHFIAISFRVLQPGIRVGRKIRVIDKNIFGLLEFFELHEEAFLAGVHFEWIVDFAILKIGSCRVGLAKGRHAEINKGAPQS